MVAKATHNAFLKDGDTPTKSIVSQRLLIINLINLYKIKVKHVPFIPCPENANLICIFMNINENL